MSHITTCAVQMKNVACLNKAIQHCGLRNLGQKTHQLWNNQSADGIGVQLPDWHHPVVINTTDGKAVYDNYNGGWGKQVELDKLVQRYSIETALEQADQNGYTYEEQTLANGDIELQLTQLASC